jgi:hypothetical protein
MTQTGAGSSEGNSSPGRIDGARFDTAHVPQHGLLLRIGLFINGHRGWLAAITAGVLPAAAAVLAVVGTDLKDGGDWACVLGAGAALIAGALLQLLSSWAEKQVAEIQLEAADALRVKLKDTLQPIIGRIADMAPMNTKDRAMTFDAVIEQAVGALVHIFDHVDRARATVYRIVLRDGSSSDSDGHMECISYAGRGGATPQPFVQYTSRGESALSMVRSGEDLLVANIEQFETGAPDYRDRRGGYKTFIACSITTGNELHGTNPPKHHGMVTVDAPLPNSLSAPDTQVVGLMADLLAVAFALQTRPRRGVGKSAGVGIKSQSATR